MAQVKCKMHLTVCIFMDLIWVIVKLMFCAYDENITDPLLLFWGLGFFSQILLPSLYSLFLLRPKAS